MSGGADWIDSDTADAPRPKTRFPLSQSRRVALLLGGMAASLYLACSLLVSGAKTAAGTDGLKGEVSEARAKGAAERTAEQDRAMLRLRLKAIEELARHLSPDQIEILNEEEILRARRFGPEPSSAK